MKLFNSIYLEIASLCNRSCQFCPVAYNTRPDVKLSEEIWNKAVEELAALHYRGRAMLYIYNEPMRDFTLIQERIEHLRKSVPKCCIMIATNGDYLHRKTARDSASVIENLFSIGLNQLLINCYSPGLYERRVKWLEHLPSQISRRGNVYGQLGSRAAEIRILDKSRLEKFGTGVFRLTNRAGSIPSFRAPLQTPVERMCVRPFRVLNINYMGEALLCCQDYHGQLRIGNLADNTLEQLWNHPVLNRYRKNLLGKDRNLPLCSTCDCHAGAYSYNVPRPTGRCASRQEILRRFTPLTTEGLSNAR